MSWLRLRSFCLKFVAQVIQRVGFGFRVGSEDLPRRALGRRSRRAGSDAESAFLRAQRLEVVVHAGHRGHTAAGTRICSAGQ
jgi:hypothetical protein